MKQKINITSILLSYFIFQGSFLFGQDNFVKLNIAGLLNPMFFEKEIRPSLPPTISIGYEKGLNKSNYSIGVQINYGYTNFHYSNISVDYILHSVITYKGVSLFVDFRKYLKQKKALNTKTLNFEGVFLGLYNSFQNLNENSFINYSHYDHSAKDFYLDESNKILGISLGVEIGYKRTIYKKFYFETNLGMGYGYYTKSIVPKAYNYIFLNSLRTELSLGYKGYESLY